MSNIKTKAPLVGRVVSYHGHDMEVIGARVIKGRFTYIGRPPGGYLEYYMKPERIEEVQ